MLARGCISPGDENLLTVEDDPAEVVRIIQEAHAQRNGTDADLAGAAGAEDTPVIGD